MSRAWVTCTGCNRVLFAEDGPTCPECLEAQRRRDEESAMVEAAAEEDNESTEGDAGE